MDITSTTKQTTKTTQSKRRSLPGQVIVKSTSTNTARDTTDRDKIKMFSSPTMFSNTNKQKTKPQKIKIKQQQPTISTVTTLLFPISLIGWPNTKSLEFL